MNKKIKNLLLVGAAFAGLIGTAVSCQDYETDINDLKQQISELRDTKLAEISSQIAAINTSLSDLKAVDEGLKTQISGLKTDLATAKSELEAKINAGDATLQGEIDELNTKINGLETRIASLESAKTQMEDAIAKIEEKLPTFETISHAEATYATKEYVLSVEQALSEAIAACIDPEELNDALAVVYNTINDNKTQMEGFVIEALKDYVELSDFNDLKDFVGQINSALTNLASSMEEEVDGMIMRALESYYDAATIDALVGNFTEVYGENSSITAQINNLWTSYSELAGSIEEAIDYAIKDACANGGIISKTINEKIEAAINEVDATIENIVTVIWGLQIDVQGLINQVQSIAYVPTHRDHKARVNVLYESATNANGATPKAVEGPFANLVAVGTTKMEYQIQPVDVVDDIVAVWKANAKAGITPNILSYYTVEVKADEETKPELVIENVEAGAEPGRLLVTARPAFKNEFWGAWLDLPWVSLWFAGETSYSVALKLEDVVKVTPEAAPYEEEANEDNRVDSNVKNNLTSEFVNLVPEKSTVEGIVLVGKDENGLEDIFDGSEVMEYTIDYTDIDTTIVLFDGYKPALVINGKPVTAAQVKEDYNLDIQVDTCYHHGYNPKGAKVSETIAEAAEKVNLKVVDNKVNECNEEVSLVKVDKSFRDYSLLSTHAYKAGQLAAEFQSSVKIVKTTRVLKLDNIIKYWTYPEYKTDMAGYEGKAITLASAAENLDVLPEDILPADLAKYSYDKVLSTTITENGKAVEGVKAKLNTALDEVGNFQIDIEGYKYRHNYNVVIECEYSNIVVKYVVNISFIGLPEKIEYAYNNGDVTPIKYVYSGVLASDVEDQTGAEADQPAERIYSVFKAEPENPIAALFAQVDNGAFFPGVKADAEAGVAAVAGVDQFVEFVWGYRDEQQKASPVKVVSWKNGQRLLSHNHTLTNSNLSTYTSVRNEKAGDKLYPQINEKDVTAETDVFADTTTIKSSEGMLVELTAQAAIVMPNYVVRHNTGFTYANGGKWYSDVKPNWTPNNTADAQVSAFDVKQIDLRSAFVVTEIVDGKAKDIPESDWAALGIDLTFAIEGKVTAAEATETNPETFKGIDIDANGHIMTYLGKEDTTPVEGTLTVGGIAISNAFAAYDEYEVVKYDPIGEFTAGKKTINVSTMQEATYKEFVFSLLSLKDIRGKELVKKTSQNVDDAWVDGNNENGFATRANAGKVYQINTIDFELDSIEYQNIEGDPAFDLAKYLKFDETTGVITFSGANELNLTDNVIVRIVVTIDYPWGVKTGDVIYTITK